MKIIMLAPFAFTPKATVSARAFPMAQALVKRGHDITIYMPPYDNLGDAGRVSEQDGVQLYNLNIRRVGALTPLTAARQMAIWAHRERPDVIHVFKPVGYAALAGMMLALTTRIPLVTDSDDWEGTGGWNSVNPYPQHWKRFFDFQERWLPRHSATVTVASRTLETQMWGLGIPPDRVRYVPNCPGAAFLKERQQLDRSQAAFLRRELGIGNAPMAIYVGHITLGDDLDIALGAWKKVQEQLPTAQLVIVGSGDGLERLQAWVQTMDLAQAVTFTGWVDHSLVPSYLAAANAAVYPYRDTLINRAKCSIKVLEYMAMGKAVVTHRVGQNTEYLEHLHSGYLAEPGSVEDFAAGLLQVLQDRDLAQRLGDNAAQRIEHKFSWATRIEDVERAYKDACKADRTTNHPGTRSRSGSL